MYCSKLWFTSVEMLCTICKCFWLLIFFFYVQTCQVPTYMCVLYRYLNLLVDLLLKVLKHWMYIHVCTDVSVRTNLFSLRFPGTCCTVSSVIVQEHCTSQKNTVIVKCQGQRSLICYTLICIWSVYISFAILNKVNETELVFSVNLLVYYKHVCYNCVWSLLEFSLSL